MKKVIVAILVSFCGAVSAQEVVNDSIKSISIDSLQQAVNLHQLKFDALNEQLSPMQEQVDKMAKLRISGYMQVQYEMYDFQDMPTKDGLFQLKPGSSETNVPLSTNTVAVANSFAIRRARIKFTYQPIEGVSFVLQPNFSFSAVTLKDAYVQLNDPWINVFQLWVGQFNRPDYEVAFSSSNRIILERSKMSGILYPQERDLGAKLVANLATQYEIPLNFELAFFNGNFGEGAITNQEKDIDSQKDVMVRANYSLNFKNIGLGVDFGASQFYGKNTVFVAGNFSDKDNNTFAAKIGDQLDKHWSGVELQAFYDVLGGIALKSEYNFGTISGQSNTVSPLNNNPGFNFSGVRDFAGYYVTLEKNFGTKYQAAARYDSWDPNTRLSGNDVTVAPDLKIHTWSFALDYFFNTTTKIALGYSMPINETSTGIAGGLYEKDIKNNTTTLRFQVNF
jgi:hypothetical protein